MRRWVIVNWLLRFSPASPRVRMQVLEPRALVQTQLVELHTMSARLMAEDLEHFRVHALSNDEVHVFRRVDTGAVVGFQFWRTVPIALPRCSLVLGGKLRMETGFRNRALHLLSGLSYYLRARLRSPFTRFYRIGIASMFGFVSVTEALADYRVFDPREHGAVEDAIAAAFEQRARDSDFRVDGAGVFHVGIHITPQTLAQYSPQYFQRPAALAYARVNPDFRTNGCYAGFWFELTPRNLLAVAKTVRRKLLRRVRVTSS